MVQRVSQSDTPPLSLLSRHAQLQKRVLKNKRKMAKHKLVGREVLLLLTRESDEIYIPNSNLLLETKSCEQYACHQSRTAIFSSISIMCLKRQPRT